jgi:hypothetical protein
MYFDRNDICEAYYLYAVENSDGQGSLEYAVLSKLDDMGFEPRRGLRNPEDLTENGEEIYNDLVSRGGMNIRDRR